MTRIFLLLMLLGGCGRDPCDDVRDLTRSPAGLELVQREHPLGWGHDACFQCHQTWNIHQTTCIDVDGVAASAINDAIDLDDTRSCTTCHGTNGVDWGDDTGGSP